MWVCLQLCWNSELHVRIICFEAAFLINIGRRMSFWGWTLDALSFPRMIVRVRSDACVERGTLIHVCCIHRAGVFDWIVIWLEVSVLWDYLWCVKQIVPRSCLWGDLLIQEMMGLNDELWAMLRLVLLIQSVLRSWHCVHYVIPRWLL